jgi:hypothetical protein
MHHPVIKHLLVFTFFLCSVWAARSQNYNYAPNTIQIPNLTQKGDLIFSAGLSRGQSFSGYDLQGVYSPVKNFAVLANYFDAGSNNLIKDSKVGTKIRFGEIGLAAYQKVAKGSVSLLAGYGIGKVFNQFALLRQSNLPLSRWFIQPSLSYQDTYFRGALALRLTRLFYGKGSIDYSIDDYHLKAIQQIEDNAPFFQPEIGLSGGFRFKPVWINLTISAIYPNTDGLNFSRYNIDISAMLNLREVGHRKTKKKK